MTSRVTGPLDDTGGQPRPIVGISTYAVYADWTAWKAACLLTPRTYVEKVTAAGGIPLLLPPQLTQVEAIPRVLSLLDACVLIGGEDMCGKWSSREESAEDHAHHNLERDAFEIALAQAAWELDMPLLGICRGAQVLNVSRGGTLIEDLVAAGASDVHRRTLGVFHQHPVTFDAATSPRGAYDPAALVQSHHHQAIDEVGDGLAVIGTAEDGVVEAVEAVDRHFIVGVQWHPEEASDDLLFPALIDATLSRSPSA